MGANMYAHVEVKKNNQWHHFSAPIIDRNYQLFAVINGVRNEHWPYITPVAWIRELPSDISLVTRVCAEQDTVRHPCVLTAEDLDLLQDKLYELNPNVKRTGIDSLDLEYSIFKCYINGNSLAQHQGWDDLRVVIWFDE